MCKQRELCLMDRFSIHIMNLVEVEAEEQGGEAVIGLEELHSKIPEKCKEIIEGISAEEMGTMSAERKIVSPKQNAK